MRSKFVLPLLIYLLTSFGCESRIGGVTDNDRIDLDQEVTNRQPQDPIFIDFEKNWRQFISTAPELALPVILPDVPAEEPWEPMIIAECVFSPDAGALVSQVTLSWNEPVGSDPDVIVGNAERVEQQRQPPPAQQSPPDQQKPNVGTQRMQRIDLAVHHDGFGRNYFSTALTSAALERFNLPPNSGLIGDTEAVLLTGPALFPKLMDYRVETIQDRDTARQFTRQKVVLRDLSDGLTYKIRLSGPGKESWTEDKQYVFLTPVCPDSF